MTFSISSANTELQLKASRKNPKNEIRIFVKNFQVK